jgi:hypothetical protein
MFISEIVEGQRQSTRAAMLCSPIWKESEDFISVIRGYSNLDSGAPALRHSRGTKLASRDSPKPSFFFWVYRNPLDTVEGRRNILLNICLISLSREVKRVHEGMSSSGT